MTPPLSSLPDQSGVFVQGASRGLGLAFVELALSNPKIARVLATSRDPQRSDGLQALKEEHGERLVLASLDVSDEESIAEVVEDFGKLDQPLHLVLNVAGVLHDESRQMMPEKRVEDLRPENAVYSFRVNALGPLLVARHALELLAPGRSVIANLSARVGSITDNGLGGWYSYRAAKAAQNMFTRTLSIELGRYRKSYEAICVALHPGTVKTELSAPFRKHVAEEKLFSPERAARQLLGIIDGLSKKDQGKFFAWNGEEIPF